MTEATGRALVLGGGGVVGIAWETGLLVGLRDGGIDVTDADLIVGTSAGSTVGSQVAAGRDLDELLATQLGPSDGRMERLAADIDVAAALEFWDWLAVQTEFGMAELREIGQRSLAARTPSVEARLEMVEARLGLREWPDRALRLTAIDCETGEFVWWDRSGPATLVQAVASSRTRRSSLLRRWVSLAHLCRPGRWLRTGADHRSHLLHRRCDRPGCDRDDRC
jgi:NTE family protein